MRNHIMKVCSKSEAKKLNEAISHKICNLVDDQYYENDITENILTVLVRMLEDMPLDKINQYLESCFEEIK